MKRTISIILATVMLLSLVACGKHADPWQEQYDLGVRYLSEGNYEEAIIAFTAAIEIDPHNPETYGKMAEVYIALGDIDAAKEILEQGTNETDNDSLRKQLEGLKPAISESLLEKNASRNMIDIDDITFCGYKVSSMDFNALTAAAYISMMKNEGFSEGTENVDAAERWTVRRSQDYEEKWGKYTGFGNASVSVESDSDTIDFQTHCSSTYYGEKQLSIGIKDICIGSSVEEVLSNLGFENSAEISEKLHEVFSETKSIGDDAVEDALDAMLQYSGDSFWTGDVWVEPDNWELTLFVDNVNNADFYTLKFHFGASGQAIKIYDDSIGKYRDWSEYKDCLTWFEITVFK